MKRLECTKCRQLQHLCNCDTQTVDFVDLPEPVYLRSYNLRKGIKGDLRLQRKPDDLTPSEEAEFDRLTRHC